MAAFIATMTPARQNEQIDLMITIDEEGLYDDIHISSLLMRNDADTGKGDFAGAIDFEGECGSMSHKDHYPSVDTFCKMNGL